MTSSKLYIIATPIGNRLDITLRALETLKGLTHIFAEDTREIAKLLELHGIDAGSKKLHSYASHNLKAATEKAIEILREKFTSVAAFGPQQLVEFHSAPDADTQAMHARRAYELVHRFLSLL